MKAFIFPGQGAQFPGMGKIFSIRILLQKNVLNKPMPFWDLTLLKSCLVKIPKP